MPNVFRSAVGGMLLLGHGATETTGLIPDTPAHWAGAIATLLSFVNIAGGFLVSGKMLDLFRRPTDPKDYFGLYAIPGGLLMAGVAGAGVTGQADLGIMAGVAAVASAICCISGIAGLANQESARTGNVLGMGGVSFGLAATLADMSTAGASVAAFEQVGLLGGIGSSIGAVVASKVGPTELPQTVAAFHSLVGLAAMAGAGGEFLAGGDFSAGTLAAIYLATFIGGITFTGSIVAFGKLAGILDSAPLSLPGRDQLNLAMLTISGLGMATFLDPSLAAMVDPSLLGSDVLQLGSLGLVAGISSLLGLHLTASIGK
jgi:NAD(P) transhydrogenase